MLDKAIAQMRDYGLLVEDPVIGELKRCDVDGDRRGSLNGWYSLFSMSLKNGKEIITGAYGSWKRGDTQKIWTKGLGIDADERRAINERIKENKRISAELREKAARRAAYKARGVWKKLAELGESEYLKSKQVKPHRVRFGNNGSLVIPLQDVDDNINGLQFIHFDREDGSSRKIFWPQGVRVEENFFVIGKIKRGKPIYFAEGYATAASIHECLGVPVVTVFNSGNMVPVARAFLASIPGSAHVYCADDDWKTTDSKGAPYNPGLKAAKAAAEVSQGFVVRPSFKDRRDGDVDFNDLFVAEGVDAVKACFKELREEISHWKLQLGRTNTGSLKTDTNNIYLILSNDPGWEGVIKFSVFSHTVRKVKKPPFEKESRASAKDEWRDSDTFRTDVWLAQNYGISAKPAVIDAAIDLVARDNEYHPVQDYLNSLVWDRKVRLEFWTNIYLGAKISQYHMLAGTKFLVSAVARVFEYPCKADHVLILEGEQGAGKSTVLEILGGEWYSDTHFLLGEKDGYQQICGVWICELGELDSFNKADTTRAKGFFSSISDRYRPPYGKRPDDFDRQCVFAGSTNQDAYLKDPTGNRRYWPVHCKKIDFEALRRDRDQLWAEAMYRYREGVKWHVSKDEIPIFEPHQDSRFMSDSWEEIVSDWVDSPGTCQIQKLSLGDVFLGALRMEPFAWKRPEETRLGLIMSRLGWTRERVREDGKRVYKYVRPGIGSKEDEDG